MIYTINRPQTLDLTDDFTRKKVDKNTNSSNNPLRNRMEFNHSNYKKENRIVIHNYTYFNQIHHFLANNLTDTILNSASIEQIKFINPEVDNQLDNTPHHHNWHQIRIEKRKVENVQYISIAFAQIHWRVFHYVICYFLGHQIVFVEVFELLDFLFHPVYIYHLEYNLVNDGEYHEQVDLFDNTIRLKIYFVSIVVS